MKNRFVNSLLNRKLEEIDELKEQIKNKDVEILRLQNEVVKRNQYKINEGYLKNIHTYYENLEANLKIARKCVEHYAENGYSKAIQCLKEIK